MNYLSFWWCQAMRDEQGYMFMTYWETNLLRRAVLWVWLPLQHWQVQVEKNATTSSQLSQLST